MSEIWFYTAARLGELRNLIPIYKTVNGWPLLLIRDGQEVHAIYNLCPHLGVRLNATRVVNGAIVCPRHYARFDLATGRCLESLSGNEPDGLGPLTRFETRVVGARVDVALPRP